MKTHAVSSLLVAIGCFFIFSASASADPVPAQNHSPVWFGVLYPAADSPFAVPEGEWKYRIDLDYSNIFFIPSDSSWNVMYQMDLSQLTFDVRRGFAYGLEAGVEQPFTYMEGGFSEAWVMYYHHVFGFLNYYAQDQFPVNRFNYNVTHNGVVWNRAMPNNASNGDTKLWLKKELFDIADTAASVKLMVQAPTASTTVGMGAGSWQYGGILIVGAKTGDLETDLAGGAIIPGFINRGEQVALSPYGYGNLDFDYRITSRWSGLLQFDVASSPYITYGVQMMSQIWYSATFGPTYITDSGKKIQITWTKDLSKTAPDFTLHIGMKF